MTKLRSLALIAVASAVTALPVSAGGTPFTWSWSNLCGGNNFSTCSSGTVSYDGAGLLTVNITNKGVDPLIAGSYPDIVFTQVGVINVPAGSTQVTQGTAPTGWTWGATPLGGAGLGKTNPASKRTVFGYDGPGGNGGITLNQSGTFTFAIGNVDPSNFGIGVHAQRGPNGCSTKFAVLRSNGTGGVMLDNSGNTDATTSCNGTSVPEPGSMALLATGLAGMAFIGRRRRSGAELVDENDNEVAA